MGEGSMSGKENESYIPEIGDVVHWIWTERSRKGEVSHAFLVLNKDSTHREIPLTLMDLEDNKVIGFDVGWVVRPSSGYAWGYWELLA